MSSPDPDTWLLGKIDAREGAWTGEAAQTRTLIDDLTARLRELDEALDHLRIARKTLLSLANEHQDGRTISPSCPTIPPTSRFSPPSPMSPGR
ncbi:hypothetical protein [Nonomuraea africana]|uniref:hypothetical protein n=1 Tax=Nonomuraea africana TaxID=46171 RepID=UPI0033C03E0C